ncbi:hypothetical protein [Hydrocarboniphaga effusa]|uniref:hypothetical protein n=1 Tax=Hydrocarboniphaga effusa TaxID=243629 RepID=UPI00398BE225
MKDRSNSPLKRGLGLLCLFVGTVCWADGGGRDHAAYPVIPEPMVFDMMRPLGAARGETEINALGTVPLSGESREIAWAPEIECAFADGYAIEFELPFGNSQLLEYKLGLQAAFGTFDGGRSAHGVQYLGIYERDGGDYLSSLIYMLGHRYGGGWSSMSMIGLGDIGGLSARARNDVILNHSTFWSTDQTTLGLEVNYRDGEHESVLLMPQLHRKLPASFNLQAGVGSEKRRGDSFRPQIGLRLVREL